MFVLVNFLVSFVLGIMDSIMSGAANSDARILGGAYSLAVLIPSIAVGVRRLHDTDRSGLWLLLAFVPLVNIYLIVLLATDGTHGPNQYGPDPKAFGAPVMATGAPVATAPAGWLPDPMGRFELRYWNGAVWTEHVSTGSQTSVDPL